MYQRPSEPLSIGGVLDNGIQLFKDSLVRVFPLSLAGGLLSTLPEIVTRLTGLGSVETALLGGGIGMGMVLVTVLIAFLLTMAAYLAVLAMLGASILYSLAVLVGMILLIVPGIIISVYWILYAIAVVADRKGPAQSLGCSYQLIKGYWWQTSAILGVLGIIAMVLYSALVMLVAGGMAGGAPDSEESVGLLVFTFVITPLVTAVMMPFFYALLLVAYNDLKLRREGDDLLRRAELSVSV